ncbi:MAG: glutamine-hydrolyzing GMP synthase [candidate division Zixibacteria bacterium]|nr:glutamine-hydrolyzing GMP synthase [candidate division Zixibacteria bacterium]
MTAQANELILILDFGSQYTQLIARRVREKHVYCEIHPCNVAFEKLSNRNIRGIILSGGPASVLEPSAPNADRRFFDLKVPVLGVCYGMQLVAREYGGRLLRSESREYGRAVIKADTSSRLFRGTTSQSTVWMSHGDTISVIPNGFVATASTTDVAVAAMENPSISIYCLQFHPEVVHTEQGRTILHNFLHDICGVRGDWTMTSFVERTIADIRSRVGESKVILGISGGVDSAVAGLLLRRAIGDRLIAVFVDNGLLRLNEENDVLDALEHLDLHVKRVNAGQQFLSELKGVTDPETKRKIIGRLFIEVFEREAKRYGDIRFLAQGTLYPDVIESVSFKGPSATIKSHHNVGGLPEKMHLELVEPLRELFKDEVREIGTQLGLAHHILMRHPFPGPGLAVRVLGEITPERLDILRKVDAIFIDLLRKRNLYEEIWQAFSTLLPIRTVGVMGDERTYDYVIALRAVTSMDGMTADWAKIPHEVLGEASSLIINNVKGVNRVVYDISSKPPATIEWE